MYDCGHNISHIIHTSTALTTFLILRLDPNGARQFVKEKMKTKLQF